jgi:ankyrin repeat protein
MRFNKENEVYGAHLGATPLLIADQNGHLDVVRCLGMELGADINHVMADSATPLLLAAQKGHLDVVQCLCLVNKLGADINYADRDGCTALMMASYEKHTKVVKWLIKHGADAGAAGRLGTASAWSKLGGAPIVQTQYLEAKAHCSDPGCSGAGLKKCTECKQARYCRKTCQLAHWKAHMADCNAEKEF